MSKRSYVAIALLLGASLIGCQTTGLAPLSPQDAIVSTSLGARDGGTIVVRLATQSALRIMAEAVKLADVDHFAVKLYKAPVGTPDPVNDEQVGTTMTLPAAGVLTGEFKDLPLGEYYLAVDALDASANSLVEGGGQVLSAKVDVSSAGATYPLSVDVQLRHATGGESTITITAPATFSGTKSYGLTLVDKATKDVISHYRSASSTVYLKALKDGDYDLWIHAADETANIATPARPFTISVSEGVAVVGGTITAAIDPKMIKFQDAGSGALPSIAVAPNGTVYATRPAGKTVWGVDVASAAIVAGNGAIGGFNSGDPALGPVLSSPWGVAVAPSGRIYIADGGSPFDLTYIENGNIYKTGVTLANQPRVAVSGSGDAYYRTASGIYRLDGSLLANGTYNALAADMAGNIYYSTASEVTLHVLRAGKYFMEDKSVGEKITVPTTGLGNIDGISVDPAGNVYIAAKLPSTKVTMISRSDKKMYTVAGGGELSLATAQSPTETKIGNISAIAIGSDGKLCISANASGAQYQVWGVY